ncbi:MAG: NUDIX hydrolase [Candidatus Melainabacteria bacterium]|nr:NUDIX hydrolase [Candidatus Melainabacteria bacterium]
MTTKRPEILSRSTIWQKGTQAIETVEFCSVAGIIDQCAIVRAIPGVVIFAVNDNDEVVLLESYRLAVETTLIELPAGKIDRIDAPLQEAQRELKEETGLTATEWIELGTTWGAQGSSDWICHYFLARKLESIGQPCATEENHTIFWLSVSECWDWVRQGRICNNFSIVGITKALLYLNRLHLTA